MSWLPDPWPLALLSTGLLLFAWALLRMDVGNASRALRSACGHLRDRVRQSAGPYLHLDAGAPAGDDRRGAGAHGAAREVDAGHFSEAEFLARFGGGEAAEPREAAPLELPDTVAATPMPPGSHQPELSEPSALLDARECSALAAAVPVRHRWRRWFLLYSTGRDGISLQTLYRNSAKCGPTILVVRDSAGHVFGCFCAEPWRVAPRYYGTGESFVFQLKPEMALWRWYQKRMALGRNDFFQYGTPACLALGGAPAYALKLDGELGSGSSGNSETFGNAPLAAGGEFAIGRLELWGLV